MGPLASPLLPLALLPLALLSPVAADNNFLTGATDILAARGAEGDIMASPFAVQFGKKDIWLPRSGHQVSVTVNSLAAPGLAMVLDSTGIAYFPTHGPPGGRQYRFWTALLGMGEPTQKHRTNAASPAQLDQLGLRPGPNTIKYKVTTKSGSRVVAEAVLHLLNSTARLVVSDIDGTVTKSNVRGFILPALGFSDWKHQGVVELYSRIAAQGYTLLFLTNRAIGQSAMTRDYVHSLREGSHEMPRGPVLLQVESVLGVLETELVQGQPEVNKIASLSRVRGLFPGREPFWAGYGNKEWDILAYKAVGISPDRIFSVLPDSRVVSEGTGLAGNYSEMIRAVPDLYPTFQ